VALFTHLRIILIGELRSRECDSGFLERGTCSGMLTRAHVSSKTVIGEGHATGCRWSVASLACGGGSCEKGVAICDVAERSASKTMGQEGVRIEPELSAPVIMGRNEQYDLQ